MKEVSILDVAKQAGVSPATVSRALNSPNIVAPKTLKKIRQVVKDLNFELSERRPSGTARPPRKKRELVSFIVLVDPAQKNLEISSTILEIKQAINETAAQKGMRTDMHIISRYDALPDEILNLNPDGVILAGWRPEKILADRLRERNCCWVLDNMFRPEWGDQVLPDHEEVGHLAADYFMQHNCRRVISINLRPQNRISMLRDHGVRASNPLFEYTTLAAGEGFSEFPYTRPAETYIDEITEKYRQIKKKPDGIFIDSDFDAALLIPHFNKNKIPLTGITLLSSDKQDAVLKNLRPRPATIDVHFKRIGEIAVGHLYDRIHSKVPLPRIRTLVAPSI
ncbi:MAG: LacI family DNA-binding transcriptional regulator [Kiritimatiellales bacterium]